MYQKNAKNTKKLLNTLQDGWWYKYCYWSNNISNTSLSYTSGFNRGNFEEIIYRAL